MAMFIPYDRAGRAAQQQAMLSAVMGLQQVQATRQAERQQRISDEVAGTASGSMQQWLADQEQQDPQALRRTLRRAGYGRREAEDAIARATEQVRTDNLDPQTVQRQAAAEMLRGSGDIPTQGGQNYQAVSRLQMVAEQAPSGPPTMQQQQQQGTFQRQGQSFVSPQGRTGPPQVEMPSTDQDQGRQGGQQGQANVPPPREPENLGPQERLRYFQEVMAYDEAQQGQGEEMFPIAPAPPQQANPFAQFQGRVFETGPDGRQANVAALIQSPEFTAYLGHPYVSRGDIRTAAERGELTQDMVDQFARSQSSLIAIDTNQPHQLSPQAVVGFLSGAGIGAQVSPDGRGVVVTEGYSGQPEQVSAPPGEAPQYEHVSQDTVQRTDSLFQRARTTGNANLAATAGRQYRREALREMRTPEGRQTQVEGLLRLLTNPDPREVMIYGALVADQELMQLGNQLMLHQVALQEAMSGGMSEVEMQYMQAQTQNELAQAATRWQEIDLNQMESGVEVLSTLSNMRAGVASVQSEALQRIITAEDVENDHKRRALTELFNLQGALRGMNEETEEQFFQLLGVGVPYRSEDVARYNPERRLPGRRIEFADQAGVEGGMVDALLGP